MTQRPILLGIVGDSAAGKTTITHGLTQLLGPERVSHVCTDDYHKYDRQERARLNITPLHPDCNYLDILELHLERTHYGQSMLKPVYDTARARWFGRNTSSRANSSLWKGCTASTAPPCANSMT